MTVIKSIDEINEKIKSGKAVVLTAEEVSKMAAELSPKEIVQKVDVVTTATFGPMCSSGVFINFGHPEPPIRMQKVFLNDVEAYAGVAAVDAYLGATQLSVNNSKYGGAHVIEELIAGKDIRLKAVSNGTDCYPRKEIDTLINRDSVNEIIMFNPRNAYQNYPAATNSSENTIYTYMGTLRPNFGNVTYSTSGELSPLLNDPEMRTIGIGTRIFLCGAQGFVSWNGTQFRTNGKTNEFGIPLTQDATLAVIGNCKEMDSRYIKAAYYKGYGVSLFIGIGIPIPVLDEDMAHRVSIRNSRIETIIRDYSRAGKPEISRVNYAVLQSGKVTINGTDIKTVSLSSLRRAREIAELLKNSVVNGDFQLSQMVQAFPKKSTVKPLQIRQ
ncbi:homocysteine biosynthesis protein [bacterium]|nr:homocysteine biosynthesis protein [bacterium]MBU1635816.1 homocysteine biosynthesis protein [bacterium]